MLFTVQNLLDYLKADEYEFHGNASQKQNVIHVSVLSYDISAVHLCEKHDALFVIPPDGKLNETDGTMFAPYVMNARPAVMILLVTEQDFRTAETVFPSKYPVIVIHCNSRNTANSYYRKINSLLKTSANEDILYEGITSGLLWEEKKYERNDVVFLCKLLGISNQGPYRVFLTKFDAKKHHTLLQSKQFLNAKYQIRMTVIWGNCLVGIVVGELTKRERFAEIQRSLAEDCGLEIKFSLSSPIQSLTDVHCGLQEALRTYDLVNLLNHKCKNVLGYDELGIYQVLFELNNSTVFDSFCHSVFRSLWDYDRDNNTSLFQTLESYFRNEFDQKQTAADLYIHINTLRYRINQIETIMGRNLKNVRDITEIETAFLVRTMSNVIF